MKIQSITGLLAVSVLSEFSDGYTQLSKGTYVQDWEDPCLDVINANRFYGSCCSFSDTDEDGRKCRLTIAGEGGSCGWNNKQYLEDCLKAGGCVSGPYTSVEYDDGVPVEKCPESQYDWQTLDTSPPPVVPTGPEYHDVTYEFIDACPQGSITALVKDTQGQPVAGMVVGFLLVGKDLNEYGDSVVTDANGYATFFFTAYDVDAGESLWCSMAVENPTLPSGNQQEPCFINVCNSPDSPTTKDCTVTKKIAKAYKRTIQENNPCECGTGKKNERKEKHALKSCISRAVRKQADSTPGLLHSSCLSSRQSAKKLTREVFKLRWKECNKPEEPALTTCPPEEPRGLKCEGDLHCKYNEEEKCCGMTYTGCKCQSGQFACSRFDCFAKVPC